MAIVLRPARADDAAAIAALYAPYVLDGTVSFETEPPDADAIAARMAAGGGLFPWIVATGGDGPHVLGYAHAAPFGVRAAYGWAVESTVYLAEGAQRQGLGRRLYAALLATLSAQGFTQAVGRIALPNPGSVALHEALGFERAGTMRAIGWKHGRWIDVDYWQRALAAPAEPPAEPRPFAETGLIQV